jgi:hypothetical protein
MNLLIKNNNNTNIDQSKRSTTWISWNESENITVIDRKNSIGDEQNNGKNRRL